MAIYARRFGVRDFSNIIRNGRHKVGASALTIGSAGVVDVNGNIVAVAAPAPSTGLSGIVVYEHVFAPDITTGQTSDDLSTAPVGKYAQLVSGKGTKVFFINTGARTLPDGSTQAAVTAVKGAPASTDVGNQLTPSATAGQWDIIAPGANGWMVIESVSGSTANGGSLTVEARLLF